MKKLFKSYSFWVAFSCSIAIFLEDFSELINLNINVSLIESVIMSFCGVLVCLGIVSKKENFKDIETEIVEDKTDKNLDNLEETEDITE